MTTTLRVGLDTTRCTPALRAAVEHGAETLAITGPSIGRRVVRYRDIPDAIAVFDGIESVLPLGRLMRHQWDLEDRHALDMMRTATGIETWLVVRGDLAEQYQPDGGPGGTPVSVAA